MTTIDQDHDYHKYSEQYARDPYFTFTKTVDIPFDDGTCQMFEEVEVTVDVTRSQGWWHVDAVYLGDRLVKQDILGSFEQIIAERISQIIEADQKAIDEAAYSKRVDL